MPQPPQLVALEVVSTQLPLHETSPFGQTQSPPLHTWPDGQAALQAPQCDALVCRSTQFWPQGVCAPQSVAQALFEQNWPEPQALLQPPQCCASPVRSTH